MPSRTIWYVPVPSVLPILLFNLVLTDNNRGSRLLKRALFSNVCPCAQVAIVVALTLGQIG